ncbi:DUF4870 family protein [Altererythrobacter lutimaris]|uniref:DUF4870 domain-containing protein n=1 Tax=Altererythrobacter lutimaris TaxID=2743979 RepID=A0A850H7I3_9SPHN|nr:hypothetical protein [Altererythrobacter lutimaris]NVE95127.1 hypothetical protein [Altererythrobacter lutimaris]
MDDKSTPTQRNSGPPATGGFDLNRPSIISLLYLASFVTGVTGLVGIVLAHIWRGESHEPWVSSHYTYLIRTFWIGFAASVVAFFLSFILIGVLLFPLIAIWVGVRSVLSMVKAQKHEPMPEPETLAF